MRDLIYTPNTKSPLDNEFRKPVEGDSGCLVLEITNDVLNDT